MNLQFDPAQLSQGYFWFGLSLLIAYGAINWVEEYNHKPTDKRFTYEERWPRWLYNLMIVAFILWIASAITQGFIFLQNNNESIIHWLTTGVDYQQIGLYYLVGWFGILIGVLVIEFFYDWCHFEENPHPMWVRAFFTLSALWIANLVIWIVIALYILINGEITKRNTASAEEVHIAVNTAKTGCTTQIIMMLALTAIFVVVLIH